MSVDIVNYRGEVVHPPYHKSFDALAMWYLPRTDQCSTLRPALEWVLYEDYKNESSTEMTDLKWEDFMAAIACSSRSFAGRHLRYLAWQGMIIRVPHKRRWTFYLDIKAIKFGRVEHIHAPFTDLPIEHRNVNAGGA